MIDPREYVEFVEREYLRDFVRAGGSAVKFAIPADDAWAGELDRHLRGAADAAGYAFAAVDAAAVKVHMVDRLFHAVAAQLDWDASARVFAGRALEELGFAPPDGDLTLERVAAAHAFDTAELLRDLKRKLQQDVLRNYDLAHELRRAMYHLCLAQVDRSDMTQGEREAVLLWLRGELRLIGAVKDLGIFQRIARHNARDLLLSTARWLASTGRSGLVLQLDIRRCAVARRPPEGDGVYYSKPATLDAYEVLRQLVDSTDELAHCFVCVVAAPQTLNDPVRGIERNYPALQTRIWDEVHDRLRENPLSALVRLSGGDG